MSNLLTKFKNYVDTDLKGNKLVKSYLLLFYILNAIYLYLEFSNDKLAKLFNAYPEQQKFYFEKAKNITSLTSSIYGLLIIINVVYLRLSLFKYRDKEFKGLREYLIINFISLLSIGIVSSILHAIFSTYYLLEPTFLVIEITIIASIIALIVLSKKRKLETL